MSGALVCGKHAYWSELSAKLALMRAWRPGRRDSGKTESRVYRCALCPGRPWHLTSQPKRGKR